MKSDEKNVILGALALGAVYWYYTKEEPKEAPTEKKDAPKGETKEESKPEKPWYKRLFTRGD